GSGQAMRRIRQRDSNLFVQDETDTFRDAILAGKIGLVQEMLRGVSDEATCHRCCTKAGQPGLQGDKDAAAWCCGPLDAAGRTALHCVACGTGQAQLQLVRVLKQHRADPNAADSNGIAPLHLAAQRGSKYIIRSLLCARADNLQRSADGRSTADFAKLNPSPVEAFEVVGWPGEAAQEKTGKAASPLLQCQAEAEGGGSSGESLLLPLLATLSWFLVLALLSTAVIRSL
ncbi:unnamed protein product, partial [Effrenium voratum]